MWPSKVLLRTADDPRDPRGGFARVLQFRAEPEELVRCVRQLWHSVLATIRNKPVQFLKNLRDASAFDALKNALPAVDDFLLDQTLHHPPIQLHPVFPPTGLRIGAVSMPFPGQKENHRFGGNPLAFACRRLNPSTAIGNEKDLQSLKGATFFIVKMVIRWMAWSRVGLV